MRTTHPQSGFTLIEVLVAILILSIGVLGATGMQFAALQANREARNQAVGVRYAQELSERMRANRLSFTSPAGNPYLKQWAAPDAPPTSQKNCAKDVCQDPVDVADWDLADLIKRVSQDNGLPEARLVVCSDSDPYDSEGVPRWECGAGANGTLFIKLGWTQADFNSSAGATSIKDGLVKASAKTSHPLVVFPVGK